MCCLSGRCKISQISELQQENNYTILHIAKKTQFPFPDRRSDMDLEVVKHYHFLVRFLCKDTKEDLKIQIMKT